MSANATNNTVTNNLSQELNSLRTEYESSESVRTARDREAVIKATDHFLDSLVRSDEAVSLFEKSAREAASYGKKLVQLVTWSGRGPTYLNQTLSELLDFGDLCARLQDYFDTTYGTDEFRVFHYPVRNTRTTALTVSWDKAGFDNADGIIRSNRERAQQRLESRTDNQAPDQRPRRREYVDQPREFQNREPREFNNREPREFNNREPREFNNREPREFNNREPREPREFQNREPREFQNRGAWQPRAPRRNFQNQPEQSAPVDTRPRRRPVSAVAAASANE